LLKNKKDDNKLNHGRYGGDQAMSRQMVSQGESSQNDLVISKDSLNFNQMRNEAAIGNLESPERKRD